MILPFRTSERLLDILDDIRIKAMTVGVEISTYSPASRRGFFDLSLKTQNETLEALDLQRTLLDSVRLIKPADQIEVQMLKKAAAHAGLRIPDDFLEKIGPRDIIELYNIDLRTQIYRNLEFLRHSSYDLLTLITTPYPLLFYREPRFAEQVIRKSDAVAKTAKASVPWDIEDHLLIERMHNHNRVFRMRMKYIAPVFSLQNGSRVAWASTLQVDCLGSAQDRNRVVPL